MKMVECILTIDISIFFHKKDHKIFKSQRERKGRGNFKGMTEILYSDLKIETYVVFRLKVLTSYQEG